MESLKMVQPILIGYMLNNNHMSTPAGCARAIPKESHANMKLFCGYFYHIWVRHWYCWIHQSWNRFPRNKGKRFNFTEPTVDGSGICNPKTCFLTDANTSTYPIGFQHHGLWVVPNKSNHEPGLCHSIFANNMVLPIRLDSTQLKKSYSFYISPVNLL